MINLAQLENDSRPRKRVQRVGRGPGSGRGKTSCRGHKGDKSRSGYKRRYGKEGGQLPLFRKLPCRGFSNARFREDRVSFNFDVLCHYFADGETVSPEALMERGLIPLTFKGNVKILCVGQMKKKLQFNGVQFSAKAAEVLKV